MLLSREELLVKLMAEKRAQPITFISKTKPRLNKKHRDTGEPCPHGEVERTQIVNAFMNIDYEAGVNRKRAKEGNDDVFVAQPRRWGKHVTRAIIEHKGSHYVQVTPRKTIESVLTENGKVVSVDAGYLPKASEGEEEYKVRDFKLDNIHQVTMNGNTYTIV